MSAKRTRSISTKLTTMNILVSGAALLLASFAFLAYDQVTFRQGLLRTLSAQAQIIGSNSVSALLFNDPESASNTLAALKSSSNISSAGILTAERQPFALYTREGEDDMQNIPTPPVSKVEDYRIGTNHAVLIRKVLSEGRVIGFVYIRADLREIDKRLWRYASISGAV